MSPFEILFISLLSLAFGSFAGAVSYRIPRGISFTRGRSVCDGCSKKISWFDNIPLLSFIRLRGKSRCCGKKISSRYPIIEGTSLIIGVLIFYFTSSYFYLFIFYLLLIILATDIERMLIFDLNIWIIFLFGFFYILLFEPDIFFPSLFAGFASALILLIINFVTSGKGMGLGDVKLAIPLGMIMGIDRFLSFLILSFLTGGVVASILLLSRKAGLKKQIPFGPFLIVSFLAILVFKIDVFSWFVW